jgi:S1-C subfamily serine protease
MDIQVRIEARTEQVSSDNRKLWPGVTVVPLSDQLRESLELDKDAKGLYVVDVTAGSPADIVGLRRGDRILSVSGEKAGDMAAFFKALREKTGSELWFGIQRGDASLESLRFKR